MRVAIYARKSTDQGERSEDAKSVTRQIEQARAFAEARGWTVLDRHIYVDDGISGAEFDRRPGFQALMQSVSPRPAFDVLVMASEDRLGREATDFMAALKRLLRAGVEVHYYLDGRRAALGTMADNLTTYVRAESAAEERRNAALRTHAALKHKAERGYVTGGRCFGYRNVDVISGTDKDGRPIRSHVTREINEAEAAVVRQIFDWYAAGDGKTRIAKRLNAMNAPSPRAQQGRPTSWSPSSVHEVLYRDLYRGLIVWNTTKKRNAWGEKQPKARAAEEYITTPAPELRIVPEALWEAVQARQTENRSRYLRATNGLLYGRPRDRDSVYLLSGFLRCASCGANWSPLTRDHGSKRAAFYHCLANHKRGAQVCGCRLSMPMARMDEAVLARLRAVLDPALVRRAVVAAIERLMQSDDLAKVATLEAERASLEEQQRRLVQAITTAGDVLALTDALKTTETRRVQVAAEIAALTINRPTVDPVAIASKAEAVAADLLALLAGAVSQTRQILRKLLKEPIQVAVLEAGDGVRLSGAINLGALVPPIVASPAGNGQIGSMPVGGTSAKKCA